MDYEKEVADRLLLIESNMGKNGVWEHLAIMGKEMFESLRDTKIITKVELRPTDMLSGSILFHVATMPNGVVLKIWQNSDAFYVAFFKQTPEYFEQQIPNTFNENGVLPCDSLDAVELRLLDFFANEIFNRANNLTLTLTEEE